MSVESFAAEFEVASQILFPHDFVRSQLFGRALIQHFALEKEVGAIRDAERFVDVVVGDEDADVFVLEFGHNGLNVLYGDRIDTGKGFVQHDEARRYSQAAGYLGTATLAAGEAVAKVFAYFLKVKFGYQAFQLFVLIGLGQSGHFEDGEDVVLHGHFAEYGCLLCQIADAGTRSFVDGVLGDVLIIEEYSSFVGDDQPRGHIESRRLAGSVRSEQPYDLSLPNLYRYVIHDRTVPVAFDQIFGAQHHGCIFFHYGSSLW